MRLWLSVEWKKARRRRLWLPVAALVAMQGLWLAWACLLYTSSDSCPWGVARCRR